MPSLCAFAITFSINADSPSIHASKKSRFQPYPSIRWVEIFVRICQRRRLIYAFLPNSIPEIPSDNRHMIPSFKRSERFPSIEILFDQQLA